MNTHDLAKKLEGLKLIQLLYVRVQCIICVAVRSIEGWKLKIVQSNYSENHI